MIGQLLLGAELATSEVKQGHLNGTEPSSMLLHTHNLCLLQSQFKISADKSVNKTLRIN